MLSFSSIGTRVGLMRFLSALVPLNSCRRHRQTRMHQDPAHFMAARTTLRSDVALAQQANRTTVLAVVGKFCRGVQHQGHFISGCKPLACGLKMSGQNIFFTDAFVGEKSIRRFSIRPVLTGHRNTLFGTVRQPLELHAEPLSQSLVLEVALGEFAIDPRIWRFCDGNRGLPALSNSVVRHRAPCESGTRIIRISSSRIACKNYLQFTEITRKVVGN
jgi:hypothetical protein